MLGSIVLVLGLGDEALAGVVVGLAGLSALVLGLEAAVASSVLPVCTRPVLARVHFVFEEWMTTHL